MSADLIDYLNARKQGLKEYASYISQGRNGYLPFLDGILKNIDIVSELDLGVVEIPLRKIRGTYTYLRSISFARNYMPLMEPDSEFAVKWQRVCNIQYNEGLRDPIKVYEYLNWFYVVEGNKRVSVLKYLDVYSFHGTVTRLVPKYDENDKDIVRYYEFMDFNKKTGINDIWLTDEKGYHELWEIIKDYHPNTRYGDDTNRFKYFSSGVYNLFRNVFYELGGDKLPMTTGDAFLDFLKIYGIKEEFSEEDLKDRIKRLISELQVKNEPEIVDVQQSPNLKLEKGLIGRLTQKTRTEKIKVGFAHATDKKTSSWTYSHELGRMHLQHILRDSVETESVFNLPESLDAVPQLQELVDNGCRIIFTTSPSLINATLKVAMDNPECNFLNCSCMHSFKHVNTYFGRIHEPRFLGGIVAGALSQTGKLGYIAPFPVPDILSGVNAFTLGARMVNPRVQVYIKWMLRWNGREETRVLSNELAQLGVDIISHHNTLANRQFSRDYGIYTVEWEDGQAVPGKYLAMPVWNWGIFYEKYLRSILAGGTRLGDTLAGGRVRNYWWGMDSGLLDFFYNKQNMPLETTKLIEFVKASLISQSYKVFSGPIYDINKRLIVDEGEELQREQILSMDWLVDGIIGDLPDMTEYRSAQDLSTGKIV
jgi:basic membrane lipoprotein Med (substrate-binding protein (PBP1-ABC) superfamily)